MRVVVVFFASLALAACSGGEADQEAIDAAVEKALAERDREEAERRQAANAGDGMAETPADEAEPAQDLAAFSTENLREGIADGMGTPYWMCTRTLSIVGEHCGCMVNRAMDADIPNAAQVGMFGGDGSRATKEQAEKFTRIVRSCSGYNVTIRDAGSRQAAAQQAAEGGAASGRRVQCSFDNTVFRYDGACNFVLGPGGDFSTTSLNGPYFQNVSRIDLDVTSKDRGTIALRYPDGEDVFVAVSRSPRDRACWEGPRLSFCAR